MPLIFNIHNLLDIDVYKEMATSHYLMHFLQHNLEYNLATNTILMFDMVPICTTSCELRKKAMPLTFYFSFVLDDTLLDKFSNGKVILNFLQPNKLQ
jgi:hypothetical protein